MLLVLAVTALFVALWTPALEAQAQRDDMLSTLFYFANWHFIVTDGSYFAGLLGASPLRHMWSLAIEEYFYLVRPLVLFGILRFSKGRRGFLLGFLAAGVAASVTGPRSSVHPF